MAAKTLKEAITFYSKTKMQGALISVLLIFSVSLLLVQSEFCQADFTVESVCAVNFGHVVSEIDNVRSTSACSHACSAIAECRSFLLNPSTGLCQINAEEAATLLQNCTANKVFYGRLQKATCRSDWLFGVCNSNSECTVPNSYCLDNTCTCLPGYSYLHRNDSCLAECTKYGSQFRRHPGGLRHHDSAVIQGITVDECKDFCINETSFVCRSVEFEMTGTLINCVLTSETALTQPADYVPYAKASTQRRSCA